MPLVDFVFVWVKNILFLGRFGRITLSIVLLAGLISPAFALADSTLMASSTASSTATTGSTHQWRPTSGRDNGFGYSNQNGISTAIANLPTTATQAVPMPVLFGVNDSDLTPNFGDPRPGGRTHEGEDIMAVNGTPIVSPTAAVVLKLETGASEGNAVYTANPGGETFVYMHLDHYGEGVQAGTVLQPGSLIGYVGNTGDAAGGPSHLHLEIHNAQGTPTDPFSRLTAEFTPAQKISYLNTILGVTADPTALAALLVENFRSTFLNDSAQNISLPTQITNAIATISSSSDVHAGVGNSLPSGDLDVGSSGADVVALQKYLIQDAVGNAALSLKAAGATGNFGSITQAALVEYQASVGISPANGYYGPETKTYITAHPITGSTLRAPAGTTTSTVTPVTTAPVAITNSSSNSSSVTSLTRDLKLGMTGQDVLALQKLLNADGYIVAASGSGSLGNETTYFGPATQAAVIKFQLAHNVAPAAGYVGPLTRGALGL